MSLSKVVVGVICQRIKEELARRRVYERDSVLECFHVSSCESELVYKIESLLEHVPA